MKNNQVHFYLTKEMAERLKNQGKKENRSVGNLLRTWIMEKLGVKTV